ncbi:hypothetical protein RCO48_25185 [Peribacillus frigoritolerans]|nr:hypothetical protein [Peribacillus frigoritolerans]
MIGEGVRDSCGKASPGETPQAQRRRGDSRTVRGKRVPVEEINGQIVQTIKGHEQNTSKCYLK